MNSGRIDLTILSPGADLVGEKLITDDITLAHYPFPQILYISLGFVLLYLRPQFIHQPCSLKQEASINIEWRIFGQT